MAVGDLTTWLLFDGIPNRKSYKFRIYMHFKYCVWSKSTCILFAFKSS